MEEAVKHLPKSDDPRLLVGTETADDAGVYQLSDDLAIINTTDYFTPIVDDPYEFGAIAVTNGLSDVYSMGGVPRTALNLVYWDKKLPIHILADILRGGADQLIKAGCALVGGHSVEAPELMYGVAVTGTVHPQRFKRNCDAQVGDVLILTKPLGVGILTTAAKFDKINEEQLRPAIDSMMTLNDVAGTVLQEFDGRSATDITGFGLAGHGYEMAAGSGVTLEFYADRIPVLPGVLELIKKRVRTRAPKTNAEYVGDHLHVERRVSKQMRQLFLEAETSGGLLIAFPEEKAHDALKALHDRGCEEARIVGAAVDGTAGDVRLLA